jgi:hypothetical protein
LGEEFHGGGFCWGLSIDLMVVMVGVIVAFGVGVDE